MPKSMSPKMQYVVSFIKSTQFFFKNCGSIRKVRIEGAIKKKKWGRVGSRLMRPRNTFVAWIPWAIILGMLKIASSCASSSLPLYCSPPITGTWKWWNNFHLCSGFQGRGVTVELFHLGVGLIPFRRRKFCWRHWWEGVLNALLLCSHPINDSFTYSENQRWGQSESACWLFYWHMENRVMTLLF